MVYYTDSLQTWTLETQLNTRVLFISYYLSCSYILEADTAPLGQFKESLQGKHAKTEWLLHDDALYQQFEEYVALHGRQKGTFQLDCMVLRSFS